jgi:hypothetical protein
VFLPRQQAKLARGAKDKEQAMSQTSNTAIAVIGIDIGKNSFHVVGHRTSTYRRRIMWRMSNAQALIFIAVVVIAVALLVLA